MQIMIDIPEEIYERFGYEYREENLISKHMNDIILDAFCNGTLLPKGHGRLIDADALEKLCYEHEIGNSAFDGKPIIAQGQYDDGDNIWKSLFDFAPTIIEAHHPVPVKKSKSKDDRDAEKQATEFLAEARECAESEV